jgi:inner membrane protein
MDNLAHTLLGLSLSKAGLERATPLATTALVISSNLPDVDVMMRLRGGALGYIEYHRGQTHSFAGLAILAAGLTGLLVFLDRRFRLRSDPFRRPVRAWRLFWISYLGGIGHMFMDFTNSYGVRPLLPFSDRWFYGDLAFVVDPWIWLILGSGTVWLTARTAPRAVFWCAVGVLTSLPIALALQNPGAELPAVPHLARALWFIGLAIILVGALLNWRRAGERVAQYSLLILALYYGGMWIANGAAIQRARRSAPADDIRAVVAWPAPANPLLWKAVVDSNDAVYVTWIDLSWSDPQWAETSRLNHELLEALEAAPEARAFLRFARHWSAKITEEADGRTIELRDLRFDVRLTARLDSDLNVTSAEVRWF